MNTTFSCRKLAIIPLILILLLPGVSQAQRRFLNRQDHDNRRFHPGFSLGINQIGFAFKPEDHPELTIASQSPGFHIGIVSNLKLARYFDLRFIPTLSFGERALVYYHNESQNEWEEIQFEPTMLEFPLHLKFKSARIINSRAYVIGGAKYSYDLRKGIGEDRAEQHLLTSRPHDLHYELGVGFDYYFYYFKFSTEIKASFGMRNLASRPSGALPGTDRFYDPIDALKSKAIMISFLFE